MTKKEIKKQFDDLKQFVVYDDKISEEKNLERLNFIRTVMDYRLERKN